jgi:hypothetical protein
MEIREEELSIIDRLPPEILVNILRFVLADDEELRRAAVPQVSRTWYYNTLEYLRTISKDLPPYQRFLLLRHVAVFRSSNWKILSSLRPVVREELLEEYWNYLQKGKRRSLLRIGYHEMTSASTLIFFLKTTRERSDLKATNYDQFHLFATTINDESKLLFSDVKVLPTISVVPLLSNKRLRFTLDKKFLVELFTRNLAWTEELVLIETSKVLIQEYDIALYITKVQTPEPSAKFEVHWPLELSFVIQFFKNVKRLILGEPIEPNFEKFLSMTLIISVNATATPRVLGIRKREKEGITERQEIAGGGEYVYSTEEDEEGVFIGLGDAVFKYAKKMGRKLGETFHLFEFPEDSSFNTLTLYKERTVVFRFNTIEEARSAIPYDRIFFSNKIPQEELERLFMLQKEELPEKALGKAKRGGEVYEF